MNRVTLFLMTKKGLDCFRKIIDNFGPEIIDFVVVGKDNGAKNDYHKELKRLAEIHKIGCFDRNKVPPIRTKYAIAISWKWIIPKVEDVQLIVLHDSLLPKYRGFAPLVSQLLNREPVIGVTAFISSSEYDKGNIIEQAETTITYPIKIEEAINKISEQYQILVCRVVDHIICNKPIPNHQQDERLATYSLWRDNEDYKINWKKSSSYIKTFIDSVGTPYLGASTTLNGRLVRILDAVETKDVEIINRDEGKVIFINDGFPVVVCGVGLLKITYAVYDSDGTSVLPLKKFRSRFK